MTQSATKLNYHVLVAAKSSSFLNKPKQAHLSGALSGTNTGCLHCQLMFRAGISVASHYHTLTRKAVARVYSDRCRVGSHTNYVRVLRR